MPYMSRTATVNRYNSPHHWIHSNTPCIIQGRSRAWQNTDSRGIKIRQNFDPSVKWREKERRPCARPAIAFQSPCIIPKCPSLSSRESVDRRELFANSKEPPSRVTQTGSREEGVIRPFSGLQGDSIYSHRFLCICYTNITWTHTRTHTHTRTYIYMDRR